MPLADIYTQARTTRARRAENSHRVSYIPIYTRTPTYPHPKNRRRQVIERARANILLTVAPRRAARTRGRNAWRAGIFVSVRAAAFSGQRQRGEKGLF